MSSHPSPTSAALNQAWPVLFVSDLAATIAEYRNLLSFVLDFEYDGFYASLTRDNATIHFRQLDTLPARLHREEVDTVDVYITVSDIGSLYQELSSVGANIVYGPVTQDYGMREFYVQDRDGNRIGFGQYVRT